MCDSIELRKFLCLIVVSTLPYAFSLNGDFVFDDSEAIVNNADVKLESDFTDAFRNDFWGTSMKSDVSHKSYRPLTVLTFRLNRWFDGGELVARNFKIANLLLHSLTGVLLYVLLKRILKTDDKERCYDKKCPVFCEKNNPWWKDEAFLSSLLFAAHPVHVEAVAGIVGRADILSAFFFMLCVLFYDLILRQNQKKSIIILILWISVFALGLLAMISKEIGVTALGVCMVYDVTRRIDFNFHLLYDRVFLGKYIKIIEDVKKNSRLFMRIAILLLCSIILLFVRASVMDFKNPQFHDIDNPASFSDTFTRISTYNYIYFLNFLLLIWPSWLCFDWSMGCVPLIKDIHDFRLVFPVIFWIIILSLICRTLTKKTCPIRRRRIIISFSFMVIPFLPASNLIMPVGFVIAERILYIPSIGFCMLVVQGFSRLIYRKYEKLFKLFFVLLLSLNMLKTFKRSEEWLHEKSLYTSALDVCPLNAKVHYNIGKNAADENNFTLAEMEYREAIRLNPKYYQAMNNLANLLKDQSRFLEAQKLLKNALDIKSDFPAAWMNLGIVLANLKLPIESEKAYLMAIKQRKNYSDCYYNLGNLYLETKKHEAALNAWSEAIKINPKHVIAWSNTLALLDNSGQIDRGLRLAPLALEQLPDSPAVHFNYANLLGKKGRFSNAETHFVKAIELQRNKPSALYYTNLGVLYERWRKRNLAKKMYEMALSIDPSYASAKDNLQRLTIK